MSASFAFTACKAQMKSQKPCPTPYNLFRSLTGLDVKIIKIEKHTACPELSGWRLCFHFFATVFLGFGDVQTSIFFFCCYNVNTRDRVEQNVGNRDGRKGQMMLQFRMQQTAWQCPDDSYQTVTVSAVPTS